MVCRIEKIVQGGSGLARLDDGRVAFVPDTVPGETVEVNVQKRKGNVLFCSLVRVIEPSEDRQVPFCRYYGICGGCEMMHISYDAQLEIKKGIIKDNLKRIGKIGVSDFEIVGSPDRKCRSRCRFHSDGRNTGFLERNSSRIVNIKSCPLLTDRINEGLRNGAFNHRGEIRVFDGDDDITTGTKAVSVTVSGKTLHADADVFFQNNRLIMGDMIDYVMEHVVGERAMDLYSGIGVFASFMADKGMHVTAVERDRRCLNFAKRNAPGAYFYTKDVALWAKDRTAPVDTIVVDPPRTGLDKDVPDLITGWGAQRIIYVSCDSATMSRDLNRIVHNGYRPIAMKAFDLYPNTSHVETVMVLEKQ